MLMCVGVFIAVVCCLLMFAVADAADAVVCWSLFVWRLLA